MSKFYFEVDDLIVGESNEPNMDRVVSINELYDAGHHIVYWTNRGGVADIDYKGLTENQLKVWGAKYQELHMDKPKFDYLVDSKAVNTDEWFRPLRIGLVLNNLVRDYLSKLIEVYSKYTTEKDALEPNMPIEPINPYQLEDSFPINDGEFDNIYLWLYHSVALEVFGGANQTKSNLLQRICLFQTKINDKLILLSKETARSKYATLSFLAKNQFDLNELIFVEDYAEYWQHVDILITDNPEILRAKPEGKTAVVLKNPYNTEFHGMEYGINSPDDIFRLPIFSRKPITKEEMIHITNEIPEGEEEDVLMSEGQIVVDGAETVNLTEEDLTAINTNPQVFNLSELRDKVDPNQKVVASDDNAI